MLLGKLFHDRGRKDSHGSVSCAVVGLGCRRLLAVVDSDGILGELGAFIAGGCLRPALALAREVRLGGAGEGEQVLVAGRMVVVDGAEVS